MCGIAGSFGSGVREQDADRMLAMITHRGPDELGTYADAHVALGTARLSILDIAHGQQPIRDPESGAVITFNGEVFNHVELREELIREGRKFKTRSDTEVILQLYLKHGESFPAKLNGQFAVAIWDPRECKLVLARDRFGICPLFYRHDGSGLLFASEIKAIFADPRVTRKVNPKALDQIFTFWTTVAGHTMAEDVRELMPGNILVLKVGSEPKISPYWTWPFPELQDKLPLDFSQAQEKLRNRLSAAIDIRLRADIEVGSYLSGGIDSSAIVALGTRLHGKKLRTYSIGFSDETYDETKYQRMVAERYCDSHVHVQCGAEDIDRVFEKVVRHAETAPFRTAPAPMSLLSAKVRENGMKVVLTGEGSDEILLGYDIFREVSVRRFCARFPDSNARPQLFKRLYAYLPQFNNPRYATLAIESFKGTLKSESPFYSHLIRWNNNAANKVYFSGDLKRELAGYEASAELAAALPAEYHEVGDIDRAQYLELQTLLRGYLLSSQGDRMLMSNSVEGRFPFLDHEFVRFANALPQRYKLRCLKDKLILREAMKGLLPEEICWRPKFAYQAPEVRAFFRADKTKSPLVDRYLTEDAARRAGFFDPGLVGALRQKIELSELSRLGTRDNMALIQILSTHILQAELMDADIPGQAREKAKGLSFKTRIREDRRTVPP